ncbi:MAG: hypothetical protein L0226_00770 [Acidobacteria bacterium]|nr:hypothetical protein [Acidobacteriota bacterium]
MSIRGELSPFTEPLVLEKNLSFLKSYEQTTTGFLANLEYELRFPRHSVWLGPADGQYQSDAVSFILPRIAASTSRKFVHTIALLCGATGLISVWFIHDKYMLLLTMVGVGIAWASILSMPYAMLSGALPPERMGVYMGIFNFFIVLPEIIAALTFKPIVKYVFNNSEVAVVVMGGVLLAIAALLTQFVRDVGYEKTIREVAPVTV